MRNALYYLACPYSGTEEEKQERYEIVSAVTAELLRMGSNVFSPITHSHPLERDFGCHLTHDKWMEYDLQWLDMSDILLVLTIDGWTESKGVQMEIARAEELGKPIQYIEKTSHLTAVG